MYLKGTVSKRLALSRTRHEFQQIKLVLKWIIGFIFQGSISFPSKVVGYQIKRSYKMKKIHSWQEHLCTNRLPNRKNFTKKVYILFRLYLGIICHIKKNYKLPYNTSTLLLFLASLRRLLSFLEVSLYVKKFVYSFLTRRI